MALNLIVDNDTLDSTRLRVPVGPPSAPQIERIPFDADRQAQPWEDATIVDRASFREFGSRVSKLLRENWSYEPLLTQCWSAAVRQSKVSNRLCDVLTAARVASERGHGLTNLELPMSRVCETGPFRWFAAHLIAHLPRVHSLYNALRRVGGEALGPTRPRSVRGARIHLGLRARDCLPRQVPRRATRL